jgi:hypothetical protein
VNSPATLAVSNIHLFPEADIENEHIFVGRFSQTMFSPIAAWRRLERMRKIGNLREEKDIVSAFFFSLFSSVSFS